MKEQARTHLSNLTGLIDGDEHDEFGRALKPLAEFLEGLIGPLFAVCEVGEEGLIPVGIAHSIEDAMAAADKLAGEVTIERVESDRSIELVPSVHRFQVVEVKSFL